MKKEWGDFVYHTQLEHWSTWACDQEIGYTFAGLKLTCLGKQSAMMQSDIQAFQSMK